MHTHPCAELGQNGATACILGSCCRIGVGTHNCRRKTTRRLEPKRTLARVQRALYSCGLPENEAPAVLSKSCSSMSSCAAKHESATGVFICLPISVKLMSDLLDAPLRHWLAGNPDIQLSSRAVQGA